MRRMKLPRQVKRCGCGGDRVTTTTNGISIVYTCVSCGDFLAELLIGAEP